MADKLVTLPIRQWRATIDHGELVISYERNSYRYWRRVANMAAIKLFISDNAPALVIGATLGILVGGLLF